MEGMAPAPWGELGMHGRSCLPACLPAGCLLRPRRHFSLHYLRQEERQTRRQGGQADLELKKGVTPAKARRWAGRKKGQACRRLPMGLGWGEAACQPSLQLRLPAFQGWGRQGRTPAQTEEEHVEQAGRLFWAEDSSLPPFLCSSCLCC